MAINSNENGILKSSEKEEKESASKQNDGNLAVKHAMAEELLHMGLHQRSVERILNIKIDQQRLEDFSDKQTGEKDHES